MHDLDVWERTQGGRAPTTGRTVQNATMIKDKDFDGKAWASTHDDSFRELIANARKNRTKMAEEKPGEEEQEQRQPQDKPDISNGEDRQSEQIHQAAIPSSQEADIPMESEPAPPAGPGGQTQFSEVRQDDDGAVQIPSDCQLPLLDSNKNGNRNTAEGAHVL